MYAIRWVDCTFSIIGLIILLPVFTVVAILIKLTSKGSVIYKQARVGKNGKDFKVYKFRSMYVDADKKGLLTIGGKDARVTPVGAYLRKFKLDELPQLLNVVKGDMSLVGPRPEVRKYVEMYSVDQRMVLAVKPGITDYASIKYRNENVLLAVASNPEELYVKEIMPKKIELNFKFINEPSIKNYFEIILKTIITSAKGK
jgi:lipopolysaccharide/colanic/teichoic acid biosynthesis glycosyltransferase